MQTASVSVGAGERITGYAVVDLNREHPFVGRQQELTALSDFGNPSNAGRILTISGEASAGKSALLYEFMLERERLGAPYGYWSFSNFPKGGETDNILLQAARLVGHPRLDSVISQIQENIDYNIATEAKIAGTAQLKEQSVTPVHGIHIGIIFPHEENKPDSTYRINRTKATETFLETLRQITDETEPNVLILDACELAGGDTRDWLFNLLSELISLPHNKLKVIIAGREDFSAELARSGLSQKNHRDKIQSIILKKFPFLHNFFSFDF